MRFKYVYLIIVTMLCGAYNTHAQSGKTSQSQNLSISTDKVYGDTTGISALPDPNNTPGVDDEDTVVTQTVDHIEPIAPAAKSNIVVTTDAELPAAKKVPIVAMPALAEKIYHYPELMPRAAIDVKTYLRDNTHMPPGGIHGTVIVDFIINEDGSMTNFTVRKSLNEACDAAAINIVSSMPKWIPGMLQGHKHVKTYYKLPVVFQ